MRFYKPGATEYQSQFSPLNLDFMQKNLAQKEANDVLAEDLLDKTSQLKVEGGMVSDPNEVKKYNDWIQTNTANIREKFASGDMDAKEASRNLAKIVQIYNTNEDIKFFNTDQKLSALTRQRIAEGKANNAISSNISYLNGNLQASPISSKSGLDALSKAHNLTNPTGIYDKENYQHQMDKFVGDAVSNQFDLAPKEYDKLTGVPMITMGNHKYTREELKAEKVREWAKNAWEQENRNSNTPFMQYQKQLYGLNGQEYTQEQFIEDAANGFPGYYKREVTQDNTSYQQMTEGKKEEKEVEAPRSNAGAGATVDYGINVNEVLNDPESFNLISKSMGELKNFDMRKMNTPGTKEYKAVSRRDINNLAIELKQPSKTSPTFKKRLALYVKNSGHWGHLAGAINDADYEIPKGTLRKLYAEFATADYEFKEDRIRTQNTDRTIAPGSAVWEDYVGVDKGAATITNMVTQARLRRSTVYSEKLQRTLTDEELVKLHENNGTTPVSGISETTPENVLTFMTGDDNFIQGINFATADDVYTINKTTTTKLDAHLNSKYREGVLNRGEWLNYGGGIKYKILKPAKGDTEVKIDFKLPNNQVIQLNSIAEFEKQREASNITVK